MTATAATLPPMDPPMTAALGPDGFDGGTYPGVFVGDSNCSNVGACERVLVCDSNCSKVGACDGVGVPLGVVVSETPSGAVTHTAIEPFVHAALSGPSTVELICVPAHVRPVYVVSTSDGDVGVHAILRVIY